MMLMPTYDKELGDDRAFYYLFICEKTRLMGKEKCPIIILSEHFPDREASTNPVHLGNITRTSQKLYRY